MSVRIEKLKGTAFLGFIEMKPMLLTELRDRLGADLSRLKDWGELVYLEDFVPENYDDENPQNSIPYFCRTALLEPFLLHFDSIGEAAGELKKIQRSWAPYQFTCFRRASLIQEKLPYVNLKNRNFPFEFPKSPIGMYTLLDDHTIIASARTSSELPAGTVVFNEDHVNPPSRAYLKIQESLAMARHFFPVEFPDEKSRCFEAGACPGGWTWVLVNLGSKVFAVDRAELAPSLMANPQVEFLAHDAFTLTPDEIGECDWVFSDVICYPERLLEWIKKWLDSGKTKKMICTIKMQGKIDWALVKQFADIPHSRVVHLNYNKHELTFIHCE